MLENDLLLFVTGGKKRGNMNFKMERVKEKAIQTDEQ